jgi:molybdenum cofactor cytidylyltransferase
LSKGEKLTDKLSAKLLSAQPSGTKGKKASVAAIILAAGIGSRSGRGKLMVPTKDDVPLFMKAVNAAIASDACPVFVITGYQHEQMAEYLDNLDVNVIYNSAYRSGIKTSLDLGLKSVPDFCDGAMILPADMPNLTGADLNKLINSFKKGKDKQISLFAHKGIKSNPIIWSKSLYDKADVVPENTDVRPVFMEHADYTNVVELKDKNKLLDVNFPSDIEKI